LRAGVARLAVFALAWLLCFCSCDRCGLQPEPGIKVVVPAMPTTLDWSNSDPSSWANYPVLLATMRGLTSLGSDSDVRPGLAESWQRQCCPDGREIYTFHLRSDVRWSDGTTPLSADDFVFAWRRAVQGRERGEMLDLLGAERALRLLDARAAAAEVQSALEGLGVQALDSRTLRVTLASPRNYFLARIANVYLFFPAPSTLLQGRSEEEIRAYFERPSGGHPLSLGPYRVDSWDRAGERVRLVRNRHSAFSAAMAAGENPADVVTLMRSEVGPALFDRGRVDFVFVDGAVALQQERRADLRRRELLSTYFLAFNTQRPPLDRAEVRRALAASLDRASLFQGLLPAARLATSLLPPGLPGAEYGESAPLLRPRDADAVLRQLRTSRALRLVYRAGESFVPEIAIAERLKAQLGAVGIRVELDPRQDFFGEIARTAADGYPAADLYLRRLGADYAHPKSFFTLFEREGNHYTGWEKLEGGAALERFEHLLRQADAMDSPSTAAPLYARAEAMLLAEQAVIAPLYHPDRYFRVRPELLGLDVDPFNFVSLSNLRVRAAAVSKRR
jgi:peptide/nickel transport system substrate-binding protein